MTHPVVLEILKFGEVTKKKSSVRSFECSCGSLIYMDSKRVYYDFGKEKICTKCIDSYIENYISAFAAEA